MNKKLTEQKKEDKQVRVDPIADTLMKIAEKGIEHVKRLGAMILAIVKKNPKPTAVIIFGVVAVATIRIWLPFVLVGIAVLVVVRLRYEEYKHRKQAEYDNYISNVRLMLFEKLYSILRTIPATPVDIGSDKDRFVEESFIDWREVPIYSCSIQKKEPNTYDPEAVEVFGIQFQRQLNKNFGVNRDFGISLPIVYINSIEDDGIEYIIELCYMDSVAARNYIYSKVNMIDANTKASTDDEDY